MSNNEADRLAKKILRALDQGDGMFDRAGVYVAVETLAALAKQQAPEATAELAAVPVDATAPELWAEIFRLRSALEGPAGFETWQDAAVAERVRRVRAESAIAAQGTQKVEATIIDSPETGYPSRVIDGKHVPCTHDGRVAEATQAAAGGAVQSHVFGKVCPHGISYTYAGGFGCGKGCAQPSQAHSPEPKTCRLTECQGQPRCKKCLRWDALDAAMPSEAAIDAEACAYEKQGYPQAFAVAFKVGARWARDRAAQSPEKP